MQISQAVKSLLICNEKSVKKKKIICARIIIGISFNTSSSLKELTFFRNNISILILKNEATHMYMYIVHAVHDCKSHTTLLYDGARYKW